MKQRPLAVTPPAVRGRIGGKGFLNGGCAAEGSGDHAQQEEQTDAHRFHVGFRRDHFLRRHLQTASRAAPASSSAQTPGTGTTAKPSSSDFPLKTYTRMKLTDGRFTLFPLPSCAHARSKPLPPPEPL